MRKALTALLLFFFVFASLFVVGAQTVKKEETVILSKDQVINDNYFAGGEKVEVLGTVNGDVYAAGGEVIIDGTINGDVIVGGGEVTISGNVSQDIRVGGGEVTIEGQVGGNVTAGGGEVMIEEEAAIAGSVVAGGGSVYILSPVGKSVTTGGGKVKLGNSVGGDVLVGSGELTLNNKANIKGNLTYYSEEKAIIQDGAVVAGRTQFHRSDPDAGGREDAIKAFFGFEVLSFLWSFLLGFLILKLVPVFARQTTDIMGKKLLISQGVGFAYLFLAPVAMIILSFTIIGIPVAILLAIGYFVHLYIAKIFVAYFIGDKLFPAKDKKEVRLLALFTGLLIYYVLHLIPGVGLVVTFLTILFGVGGLILSKRASYLQLRKNKSI